MDNNIERLIESIDNLNKFSISDLISIMSLVAAWITIIILLKDKFESKRPYLQITFELIRDNLACVVLRNVGNVPLVINKLEFDKNFVRQLPERDQFGLNDDELNKITIFPNKQWVLSLGVIIPEILEKYDIKVLNINYSYSKLGRKKKYVESTKIDFKQYSRMLVYISEIAELREQNKKLEREIKTANKEIKNIRSTLVNFYNLNDKYISTLVTGYEEVKEGDK